jgi:hypothetical protein
MEVSGQRHALAAFYPGERIPGTHWTGGWVGPRAGLDTEATGKILCLCQGSNLDRPVVKFVARHYTDWATLLTIVKAPSSIVYYSFLKSFTLFSNGPTVTVSEFHVTSTTYARNLKFRLRVMCKRGRGNLLLSASHTAACSTQLDHSTKTLTIDFHPPTRSLAYNSNPDMNERTHSLEIYHSPLSRGFDGLHFL